MRTFCGRFAPKLFCPQWPLRYTPQQMAVCTDFGRPLEEGARFCAGCGAPVQASAQPAASAGVAPAPAPVEREIRLAPQPVVSPFFVVVGIVLVLLIGGSVWLSM